MVPLPRFASWEDFSAWLEEQCRKRQAEILRGHAETIGARLAWDLEAMADLPAAPVRRLRLGHGTGQLAGIGALQDQRLFGAGRQRPQRRLDRGPC
jgi:hypothetical protein